MEYGVSKMIRLLGVALMVSLDLWCQQPLKLDKLDRAVPVHRLTFTLMHRAVYPTTATVTAGVYEIRFRNGMFARDITFDVGGKGQPRISGDNVAIIHSHSANGYGYFRFTPGTYELVVREYPQYRATLEVQP